MVFFPYHSYKTCFSTLSWMLNNLNKIYQNDWHSEWFSLFSVDCGYSDRCAPAHIDPFWIQICPPPITELYGALSLLPPPPQTDCPTARGWGDFKTAPAFKCATLPLRNSLIRYRGVIKRKVKRLESKSWKWLIVLIFNYYNIMTGLIGLIFH